jgi:predicted amidophosphoribosyltransferase
MLGTHIEALPVTATAPPVANPTDTISAARASGSFSEEPAFGAKCSKCGRPAAPTDQFCRSCGAPITPALCTNCGAPLLAGDRFCGKCGATRT